MLFSMTIIICDKLNFIRNYSHFCVLCGSAQQELIPTNYNQSCLHSHGHMVYILTYHVSKWNMQNGIWISKEIIKI
jgi:hypothetical protein